MYSIMTAAIISRVDGAAGHEAAERQSRSAPASPRSATHRRPQHVEDSAKHSSIKEKLESVREHEESGRSCSPGPPVATASTSEPQCDVMVPTSALEHIIGGRPAPMGLTRPRTAAERLSEKARSRARAFGWICKFAGTNKVRPGPYLFATMKRFWQQIRKVPAVGLVHVLSAAHVEGISSGECLVRGAAFVGSNEATT